MDKMNPRMTRNKTTHDKMIRILWQLKAESNDDDDDKSDDDDETRSPGPQA